MGLSPSRFFFYVLVPLLIGYAFLGKGFAYLGMYPIFIGEIVLALGLLTALLTGAFRAALRSPISRGLLIFMVWEAICTFPHVPQYGLNALRDGVLWGYGLFALIVAGCLLQSGWHLRIISYYRRLLPWLLAWFPIALAIEYFFPGIIPDISTRPGVDVGLLHLKGGEVAVHLGGIAVFLLLGLDQEPSGIKKFIYWAAWGAGVLLVASGTRGGLLAILAALAIPIFFGGYKLISKIVMGSGVVVLIAFMAFSLNLNLRREGTRNVGVAQVVTNAESILGSRSPNLEGSRDWRLNWWGKIIDYTYWGNYFWMGKGYGVNLTVDDGIGRGENIMLRDPHNSHLTILARSGMPGFLLWIVLQGWFSLSLIRAFRHARLLGLKGWARVNLFILAYWLAFMVYACFDVYFESPQGGIWFWSLFGTGIALLEAQRARIGAFLCLRRNLQWRGYLNLTIPLPGGPASGRSGLNA